jgi:hypothetical protein
VYSGGFIYRTTSIVHFTNEVLAYVQPEIEDPLLSSSLIHNPRLSSTGKNMLSSTAQRVLLKQVHANAAFKGQTFRLVSSMTPPSNKKEERRQIHNTAARKADASVEAPAAVVEAKTESSSIVDRFVITAEVTVSKIFPAGFGWQTASVIADSHLGYAADSTAFALTTGFGDGVGVLAGHVAYYSAKKSLVDSSIDLSKELHNGILLGSAAFCSGTAWQPTVDVLQGANLSFMEVFTGTWLGCGVAFYVGLRVGRTFLSGYLEHIHEPTYENSKTDASLSAVIGGATGFFVGTDAAYLPDQNFLIIGIQDGTPDLVGCAIAGSSTALGFMTAQTGLNVIFPTGKCWNDK